ncbi:MAG: beta-lactamase family protein [Saprospiraceae bacterium]|nr:beta-lactamase family protein [Saprospiraceae bacterium]
MRPISLRTLLLVFPLLLLAQACTNVTSQENNAYRYLSSSAPALRNPHLRSFVEEFDQYFSESMSSTRSPGAAVVIVQDSVVLFQRGYGLRVNNRKDSVDANTVFRIGSLSKGFAGVLTGMLVQEGVLHWDDKIVQFVPEFALSKPDNTGRVQLTHLLAHTTGLPYHAYTNLIEAGYDMRTIAARFARLPLRGMPGTVFSYQNAAFSLVGEAMQSATGKSYQTLLTEKIFVPIGMRTASADWLSMQRNTNIALPHTYTRRRGLTPTAITKRFYNAVPAGGVNASAADMGQWLIALLGYRPEVLPKSVLDEVFRPNVKTDGERRYYRRWGKPMEPHYGMGWRVLTHGADTIIYHGGSVNNFRSEIAFDRRDGIGICVLFNSNSPLAGSSIPVFWEKYRAYRDAIKAFERDER